MSMKLAQPVRLRLTIKRAIIEYILIQGFRGFVQSTYDTIMSERLFQYFLQRGINIANTINGDRRIGSENIETIVNLG